VYDTHFDLRGAGRQTRKGHLGEVAGDIANPCGVAHRHFSLRSPESGKKMKEKAYSSIVDARNWPDHIHDFCVWQPSLSIATSLGQCPWT